MTTRIVVPGRIDRLSVRAALGEELEFSVASDEITDWMARTNSRPADLELMGIQPATPDEQRHFVAIPWKRGRHIVRLEQRRLEGPPNGVAIHSVVIEIQAA